MTLISTTSKIKPKKTYTKVLPPISLGENSIQDDLLTDDGYAKSLINFKYDGTMLQLGRGGLVKQNGTTIGSAKIVDICKSHNKIYVATNSYVYEIASDKAVTQKFSVTGEPQLLDFNNDLIICDGGRTQLYDGTNLFYIGSHLDKITGETVNTGQDIGTTSYTGSWTTPNDGRMRKVLTLTAWMKVEGTPISISLTLGGKTSDSVLYSSIGTVYQQVDFDFTDPPVLAPNTTYNIVYTVVDGDTSNKFILGQTLTDDMIQLNGQHAPQATIGLVHNAVLWLGGDTSHPERAYISNINLADDFFSSGIAGYVSFCDSENSIITGMTLLYNQVALTGTDNGVPRTTLIDGSYYISHKFLGGSSSRFAFLGSQSSLFFVHNDGMSVSQGSDVFGDLSFNTISTPIQDRFDASDASNTVAAYIPSEKQIWVKLDTNTNLQVFNIEGSQWTQYKFAGITPSCFTEIDGDVYVGSTIGDLYKLDSSVLTDNSAAITYEWKTKNYKLGVFNKTIIKEIQIELVTGSVFGATLKCTGSFASYATTFVTTTSENHLQYRMHIIGDTIQFLLNGITTNSIPLIFGNVIIKYNTSGRNV